MKLVKRWFTKTTEGELLDGPFKTRKIAESEAKAYQKKYKYDPVIAEEEVDLEIKTVDPEYGEIVTINENGLGWL